MKIEIVSCKIAKFPNRTITPYRCAACGKVWSYDQSKDLVLMWYPAIYDHCTEYRQVYVCNSIYCATGWPPLTEISP
jgi:hypothetical protein